MKKIKALVNRYNGLTISFEEGITDFDPEVWEIIEIPVDNVNEDDEDNMYFNIGFN